MCRLLDKLPPDDVMINTAKEKLRQGTLYGSLSVALLIMSFSLTMPHLQSRRDSLGCDALCYGSLMSTRSLLSLVGAALMGRLSDVSSNSRTYCLWIGSLASLVGLMIAANTYSIRGMWWSMIPGALFQQNFEIFKALFSSSHDAVGTSTPAERAASVGMLGMAAGLAFMAGPLAGATVLKTYEQANAMGMVAIVMSAALIYQLPKPTVPMKKKVEKKSSGIVSFLDVQAARSPAGILFMFIRVCMGLAFHIFQTIWTTSLKQRFDFGPSDHGKFMSFIGLTYALSQGQISPAATWRKHVTKTPSAHDSRGLFYLGCRPVCGISNRIITVGIHYIWNDHHGPRIGQYCPDGRYKSLGIIG
jgi:MFS family permease